MKTKINMKSEVSEKALYVMYLQNSKYGFTGRVVKIYYYTTPIKLDDEMEALEMTN